MRAERIAALVLSGWVLWVQSFGPKSTQYDPWRIQASFATYEDCVRYLEDHKAKMQKSLGPEEVRTEEWPGRLDQSDKQGKVGARSICLPGTLDPRPRPK